MELTLCWRGPVGAGLFPDDPDDRDALNAPGIYLRVKRYDNGRTIGYVGQSRHLLQRFDQHLTQVLSLNAVLRDDAGLPVSRSDRFALFNALQDAGRLAVVEAGRMRFYFALAGDGFDPDYLTLLEALLKARAEACLGGACENIQTIAAGAFDHDISVVHDLSQLTPDAGATVASVVGTDPIRVPAAGEAFDHAG